MSENSSQHGRTVLPDITRSFNYLRHPTSLALLTVLSSFHQQQIIPGRTTMNLAGYLAVFTRATRLETEIIAVEPRDGFPFQSGRA